MRYPYRYGLAGQHLMKNRRGQKLYLALCYFGRGAGSTILMAMNKFIIM